MPVQSGVEQSVPVQPIAQVHSALPVIVSHVPWLLHAMPAQSGVAHSASDQPIAQVHSALPEIVSHVP